MDRLKRFAIKKVTDGLDKVLEAKAHFDKTEEKKTYTKKLTELKKHFSDVVFHGEESEKIEAYNKLTLVNRMFSEHELSSTDKKKIDELFRQYKS